MNTNTLLHRALELIKKYHITAYEIEKNTHLSAVGVQKIIDGITKKPQSPTLLAIISYITKNYESDGVEMENITKSDVRLKNFDEETETYINKNGIKFYLNPDDTTTIEVLKVPFKAYASYLEVFNDEEKLNDEFTKVTFKVDKIGKGNYLAFDSENDSMWNEGGYDTPSGAEILARELGRHLWNDGFRDSKYGFILVTHKGIFHKDIKEYNKENGNLTLASRNPTVKDFEISINDVRQIFKVIKRTF